MLSRHPSAGPCTSNHMLVPNEFEFSRDGEGPYYQVNGSALSHPSELSERQCTLSSSASILLYHPSERRYTLSSYYRRSAESCALPYVHFHPIPIS
jgi:hypothetical protein